MENNAYSLTITIENAGSAKKSPIANDNSQKKKDAGLGDKLTSIVSHKISQDFIGTSKQILMNEVNAKVGSTEVSQRIQMGMNVVQKGVGVITGGIALSKALGIAGPVGIAVSATMTAISGLFSVITKANELRNQRFEEDEALSVLRGRAGMQFNRSRGGE